MADFTMPALGADMETGKVVEWRVHPGDTVHPGDIVAVVETHKGAIDVECFLDGMISNLAPVGTAMPVGAVLATVRGAGEMEAAHEAVSTSVHQELHEVLHEALPVVAPEVSQSVPKTAAHETVHEAARVYEATIVLPPPKAPAIAETAVAVCTPEPSGGRVAVSPAARRLAQTHHVDANHLRGSGPGGAVTLADVQRAVAEAPPLAQPARQAHGGFDPAQMRQAIAAAMGRSKREIPHYYLTQTIDFGAAQAWLDAWNGAREPIDRLLPAVLLLKAAALALEQVPQLNGFYEDGVARLSPSIHLGWAVALRGGGLVAPAIHDANRKPLPALMVALRDLVQRARAGGLRSSELTDPTVTVTSLGERGADSVLGVIYPPQLAIVGFGRVAVRPWVSGAAVVARPLVSVSLAGDHRASDGHLGGQLLAAIDTALQSPERL